MAMGLEGTQSGALFVAEGLKGGGSLCPILRKLLLRPRDAILCLFSLMFERIHARVVLCSWGGLHRDVDAQQAVAIGASDATRINQLRQRHRPVHCDPMLVTEVELFLAGLLCVWSVGGRALGCARARGPVARSAALHDSDVDSLVADELYLDIASLDPRQRRSHDIVVVLPGQPEGLQSVADSQAPALGLDAVMHTEMRVEDAERFEEVKEPERLVVKGQHGGVGLHHGDATVRAGFL